MMAVAGPFLDVMVILMLAIVGGLVLWLHFRLYAFKEYENRMPDLMEKMSESMNKANRGIFEMSRLVREEGPKLDKEVYKAHQVVQDLDFMMHKAEKLLKRMDEVFDRADAVATPLVQAVKADEKNTLLGKPQAPAPKVDIKNPVVQPKIEVEKSQSHTPRTPSKPVADERQLEREFLMGLKAEIQGKVDQGAEILKTDDDAVEIKPKRMASPMAGAMAYGQQLSVATSDAEKDLRRALEGRL